MGDKDWLEQGHGRGDGLTPMIKSSSYAALDRGSIRRVLHSQSAAPRRPRRRSKALAGWLIYCCIAVGGTAAAFTVRDTLFPALGAPKDQSIWVSSKPTPTDKDGAASTEQADTTLAKAAIAEADVGETTVVTTASSVDDQTVPSASAPNQGPGNSVDDRGPGGVSPVTGTTVPDESGQGPGPGTTVGDNPTQSSTPTSASTPPTSADTTSTTPSPDDQHGKGGGSGGGGGGGGGTPVP